MRRRSSRLLSQLIVAARMRTFLSVAALILLTESGTAVAQLIPGGDQAHAVTFVEPWAGPDDSDDTVAVSIDAFSSICLSPNLDWNAPKQIARQNGWQALSNSTMHEALWGILPASMQGWMLQGGKNRIALIVGEGGDITTDQHEQFAASEELVFRSAGSADATGDHMQYCGVHFIADSTGSIRDELGSILGKQPDFKYDRIGKGRQIGRSWVAYQWTLGDGAKVHLSYDNDVGAFVTPNVEIAMSRYSQP